MTKNKGRDDSVNPTDADQANPGNTTKVDPSAVVTTEQKTDSVWLFFSQAVEVDGINYGAGKVKVAKKDSAKLLKEKGVSEVEDTTNEHTGAKPMPKDLNGPDYV